MNEEGKAMLNSLATKLNIQVAKEMNEKGKKIRNKIFLPVKMVKVQVKLVIIFQVEYS